MTDSIEGDTPIAVAASSAAPAAPPAADPTFDPRALTVAVLQGGTSAEREVSLHTGENCAAALRQAGFTVRVYDTAELSFIEALRADPPDVAFIALHGRGGEDGTMQGLLELLNIPYTGSGVMTSAVAMDKAATKGVFERAGLPVPPDLLLSRQQFPQLAVLDALPQQSDQAEEYVHTCEQLLATLGPDLVVKPNCEGSSVGVSILHLGSPTPAPGSVAAAAALIAPLVSALKAAFAHDEQVLVERFIPGREIMAGVLEDPNGNACALPLIEVESQADFYDYDSKYAPGGSRHILPARLDEVTTRRCQELAVAAHEALGCRGYSRSDIRLDPQGQPWLLETNTLPGMTATSLLPEAARAIGVEFPELVTRLVHGRTRARISASV